MNEFFEKYGIGLITACCSSCEKHSFSPTDETYTTFECLNESPNCHYEEFYPTITVEKVLELEEFVFNASQGCPFFEKSKNIYCYRYIVYFNSAIQSGWHKTRQEALTNLLTKLYDNFTDDQRQKIKEIGSNAY